MLQESSDLGSADQEPALVAKSVRFLLCDTMIQGQAGCSEHPGPAGRHEDGEVQDDVTDDISSHRTTSSSSGGYGRHNDDDDKDGDADDDDDDSNQCSPLPSPSAAWDEVFAVSVPHARTKDWLLSRQDMVEPAPNTRRYQQERHPRAVLGTKQRRRTSALDSQGETIYNSSSSSSNDSVSLPLPSLPATLSFPKAGPQALSSQTNNRGNHHHRGGQNRFVKRSPQRGSRNRDEKRNGNGRTLHPNASKDLASQKGVPNSGAQTRSQNTKTLSVALFLRNDPSQFRRPIVYSEVGDSNSVEITAL
jgi:hypothetical protein